MRPGRTMDLVIMRESTDGFYPDRNMHLGWAELMPSPDMAISIRKITAHCSNRIARSAFELAQKRRKKVTAVAQGQQLSTQNRWAVSQGGAQVATEFPGGKTR